MKDEKLYVIHIAESIDKIESYLSGISQEAFLKSTLIQDAVLRNLQIMAESTQRLSDYTKECHSDVDWYKIAGFRNVLVHDYLGIDLMTIWNIVKNELPVLKKTIQSML